MGKTCTDSEKSRMTHHEFLTLTVDEQLREERLAIMCESGMSEEEAVARLNQEQGELWAQ
jgi:hypothetical protein